MKIQGIRGISPLSCPRKMTPEGSSIPEPAMEMVIPMEMGLMELWCLVVRERPDNTSSST